jgi:hypothetical protein
MATGKPKDYMERLSEIYTDKNRERMDIDPGGTLTEGTRMGNLNILQYCKQKLTR